MLIYKFAGQYTDLGTRQIKSEGAVVNMGKGSSKEQRQHDSSASYVNAEENAIEEVPTLHTGPIHSLCVVDAEHFASGGADKVRMQGVSTRIHIAVGQKCELYAAGTSIFMECVLASRCLFL